MTLTNSTWANFRPGQLRGPSAQGMNVPFAGSLCDSSGGFDGMLLLSLVEANLVIQRLGSQVRESEPQVLGSVCKAWTLMLTKVAGGKRIELPCLVISWQWEPVNLGMKTIEP